MRRDPAMHIGDGGGRGGGHLYVSNHTLYDSVVGRGAAVLVLENVHKFNQERSNLHKF